MKKTIALLLAVTLLAAMFPAVSAAVPEQNTNLSMDAPMPEIDVTRVMDEAIQPHGTWAPSCIFPRFEMYGMTVLAGETMTVRFELDKESEETAVLLIYKGFYEDLDENSELVASGQMTSGGGSQSMYWDTTGMDAGDYTIYYTIIDAEGELLYATLTDVFISDVEIPLEKITFYVHELAMETELVRLALDGYHPESLTVSAVRHPYHTTDRRPIKIEGVYGAFSYGSGNFYAFDGFHPSGFVGRQYLCAYIDDGGFRSFLTYLNVDVEEPNETHTFIYPDENSVQKKICIDAVTPIKIKVPEGYTIDDALIQTSRPGLLSARAEGDTLYITPLIGWSTLETLVVSFGQTFDAINFYIRDHLYESEVVQQPTCTEEGLRARVCRYCSDQKDEEILPALGHDVAESVVITEPTATKDGTSVGFCTRCEQDVELTVSRIFTDTEPDWFYSDALDYCYENGIINGLTASTFGPTATLNRAQLVTMLYRHAGSPAVEGENTFADVPEGQFYTEAVAWASANGIVNGYEDGSFRPGNQITRQEIVTMLYRYVVRLGKDNGQRSELAGFTDLDQLMGYAREPMQWAVANGVINGLSETVLGPQQSANRAQTVTILYRIITGILAE